MGGGTSRGGLTIRWLKERITYNEKECLIWPFARIANGRCIIYIDGKLQYASRVMCELVHGAPPTVKHVARHSCGNGHLGCVHPEHLLWGTKQEDIQDAIAAGTFQRGETNGQSKLTVAEVLEVRASKSDTTAIASKLGITPRQVRRIRQRKDWSWL